MKIYKISMTIEIFSDQYFIAPAAREALLYARKNRTVYAYIFEYENAQLLSSVRKIGIQRGKFYFINVYCTVF